MIVVNKFRARLSPGTTVRVPAQDELSARRVILASRCPERRSQDDLEYLGQETVEIWPS